VKIKFDDNSYLEVKRSDKEDKIILIISARDYDNFKRKITNSVEISNDQFNEILKDLKIN